MTLGMWEPQPHHVTFPKGEGGGVSWGGKMRVRVGEYYEVNGKGERMEGERRVGVERRGSLVR